MKLRLFTVFAAAGFLLAGCAVEEAPMEGGSIAAVMEDIQTRTAVTDEGIFTWSAGDKVWLEITANPGYVTGTLSTGAGTGSANFAYGTYFGDMTGKAVYPFNAGHDINGDELSVVLPASYDLGTNLSNTNAAMYGVESGGNIKFNHLAGVMRFKFRNAPAGTDSFILTLDKKINGTFTADLTEDHPVLRTESASSASEKSITLNFDPLTSAQDILLYVPLPLGTYTTLGLEVKAGSQSVWSYSNTVTNTINRKSLILMPTVTLAGSISGDIEGSETPEEPSEPTPSQPSYSVQLNPATYGWVESSTVSNPDPSLYDGVYESTNQGVVNSKSIMYIDIDGYDSFTFYVRSYGESSYDYVQVSTLDGDFTDGTKLTTSGIQNSGTSLSSYTEVKFTNIGGGQHRIMIAYRKDDSVNKNDDKGYVLIPKNQENSSSDSGLEEDLEFDPDKCIYYRSNTTGGWDSGYNNYRATSSYITCNASGTTIEMKFKISPSNSPVFIAAGNNRAKDACDTFDITTSELSLYVDDGEDWFSEGWSLSDAGVTGTDLITLRLSAQDETMTINGVELPCEGLESMSWTYIFSSYYREYDEGEWKVYEGVPDGSELYYVKMYDSNGELTYFGYAAKAMNPASSQVEYCWYSSSNGVEKYQFANDSANKGGYLGNF